MKSGRVWKFRDDIDTDQIIASQYLIYPNIEEMKKYAFESLDSCFAKNVIENDIIVAGQNFGCGSSREQAPRVLKALGIYAVVAQSFGRIFYRNAINIGLPVILCESIQNDIKQGEVITVNFDAGEIIAGEKQYNCTKLPEHMQKIINKGGLIEFLNSDEAEF